MGSRDRSASPVSERLQRETGETRRRNQVGVESSPTPARPLHRPARPRALYGLRPGREGMSALRRHDRANRAGGALHLFLPGLSDRLTATYDYRLDRKSVV